MTFDETTLIICGILILLSIITPLFNPFFRCRGFIKKSKKEREDGEEPSNETLPPLTVLIAAHDNAEQLDKHLPLLLTQDYSSDYQVVVVAEMGDSETESVLKRFSNDSHLYTTFIPESSRYMSRKKLAITLGVKAAKYEWMVLVDAFSVPQSDEWLKAMAKNMTDTNHIVIGYSGYDNLAKPYYRFERLRTFYYSVFESTRRTAYNCFGSNIAFRKSDFMEGNGYQGNLNLIRGEYDFLVNKYADEDNTALEIGEKAWIRDDMPSKKTWHDKHIFYLETRKYLKRSFAHRFIYNLDMLLMHFNYLLVIAALAYSILMHQWTITSAAGLALIITLTMRILIAHCATKSFHENISLWRIIPYEIHIVWCNMANMIRYKLANRYDFTTHKL